MRELVTIWHIESQLLKQMEDRPRLRVSLLSITYHILNSLEMCVDMLRRGYRFQIPVLIRNVNEAICVSYCLAADPNLLTKIEQGKFRSREAIANVRKILPEFIRHWDVQSQYFVHINVKDYFQFATYMSEKDEAATRGCLHMLASTLMLSCIVFEFIFMTHCQSPMFWSLNDMKKPVWSLTKIGDDWLRSVNDTLNTLNLKDSE